jgi:hypothetical protein
MAAADILTSFDDDESRSAPSLISLAGDPEGADESGKHASGWFRPRSGAAGDVPSVVPRSPEPIEVEPRDEAEALRLLVASQTALTEHLASAQAELSELPYDPSSRAAANTIAARVSDLLDAREALDAFMAEVWDRESIAMELARYLGGIQRWIVATAGALSDLAHDLVGAHADWSRFRFDLALAKAEWPTELHDIAFERIQTMESAAAEDAFAEVSFALHVLSVNLDQRFG